MPRTMIQILKKNSAAEWDVSITVDAVCWYWMLNLNGETIGLLFNYLIYTVYIYIEIILVGYVYNIMIPGNLFVVINGA
jgi:hypothetical protein